MCTFFAIGFFFMRLPGISCTATSGLPPALRSRLCRHFLLHHHTQHNKQQQHTMSVAALAITTVSMVISRPKNSNRTPSRNPPAPVLLPLGLGVKDIKNPRFGNFAVMSFRAGL
jgi:hypothetical protein